MALIECHECAGALSSTAVSCPHCGYRSPSAEPSKSRNPLRGWRAVAVGVAYVLAAVGLMYAMPEYAVLLAAAALVCLIVELRSGLVRRARTGSPETDAAVPPPTSTKPARTRQTTAGRPSRWKPG
jgi:predicted amidophosphoribosyltransferase